MKALLKKLFITFDNPLQFLLHRIVLGAMVIALFAGTMTPLLAVEMPALCSRDQNPNEVTILSYHEIALKSETLDPTYTVTPENFAKQIQWLIDNGYHFISVDTLLNYRKAKTPLPPKAVLITFDDGYKSVYDNAFPILKRHHIPTVIALVGSWLASHDVVDFDGHKIDRGKFLSQTEIKEMVQSGLVEVASHSYASHKGIIGNPQGNRQPALTTHQWLVDTQRYEDDAHYEARVKEDLAHNITFLHTYTGQKPRVMVWPYGSYNRHTRLIADKLGMPLGLTLDDGSNTRLTPLWGLRRILVDGKMTLRDLEVNMWMRNANFTDDARTTKAAHIDLDYIYDPNPDQQEKNLGDLLERIKKLGVNTIYLQTFADPDANGAADYVYFPNRHIPMRADLFNRTAWQISTRTQVKRIYAWMPMLAWELPAKHPAAHDKVVTLQVDPTHLNMGYPRLSPFSARARKVIEEIYQDMAKHAYIDGILFHDDVTLSDFEDDSRFARIQYKQWGLSGRVADIRLHRKQFERWTQQKTSYLDDFALRLASIARDERPGLLTARNLYAQVALNPDAQEWYAQSLSDSIRKYDYTAIMAMPYMEQATDHKQFYEKIVERVKAQQCGLERTVMELQTVNWRKNDEPLPSDELSKTILDLYDLGVHHIAYYPDNLFRNNPDPERIHSDFGHKGIRMPTFTPLTPPEIK